MELKPGMLVLHILSEELYELVAENGNNATEWYGKSLHDDREYFIMTKCIRPFFVQIDDEFSHRILEVDGGVSIWDIKVVRQYSQKGRPTFSFVIKGNNKEYSTQIKNLEKSFIKHL